MYVPRCSAIGAIIAGAHGKGGAGGAGEGLRRRPTLHGGWVVEAGRSFVGRSVGAHDHPTMPFVGMAVGMAVGLEVIRCMLLRLEEVGRQGKSPEAHRCSWPPGMVLRRHCPLPSPARTMSTRASPSFPPQGQKGSAMDRSSTSSPLLWLDGQSSTRAGMSPQSSSSSSDISLSEAGASGGGEDGGCAACAASERQASGGAAAEGAAARAENLRRTASVNLDAGPWRWKDWRPSSRLGRAPAPAAARASSSEVRLLRLESGSARVAWSIALLCARAGWGRGGRSR